MDLTPHLASFAARQYGLFTTAQALAAGYDEREIARLLSRGRWIRLRRGIFIVAEAIPPDAAAMHVLMARAALFRLGPTASGSHVTAAVVQDLTLLEPDLSLVNITRPQLASSRIEAGVHHHTGSIGPAHLVVVDGIAVSDVARTIFDLARVSTFEQGLVAAESALWSGRTTKAAMQEVLFSCADWPGSRNAGRIVSFASSGSESPGESLARIAFDRDGLPAPRQQVEIHDNAGLVGFADFLWPDHATIGEFDGRLKYEGASASIETLYAEKRREDRLRDIGFQVVRFGWNDVRSHSGALGRRIRLAFDRAALAPSFNR